MNKILIDKSAVELALSALSEWYFGGLNGSESHDAAITALQKALAQPQQEPEIVQRVKRYAGQTLRTARNPNITARECIELANWIAAALQPAQGEKK